MSYYDAGTPIENRASRMKAVIEGRTGRYISLEDCEKAIELRSKK